MQQYVNAEERVNTIVITKTATFHAGTCTRSRVTTYLLDSSRCNHGAIRECGRKGKYHNDHKDGYTPCRHMHKE